MKDILFALLAVIFAIIAAFFFYTFQAAETEGEILYMVLGGLFVILTVICGVLFLSKRVNKSEDIHITE